MLILKDKQNRQNLQIFILLKKIKKNRDRRK